jgi:vancomycin resistance protein YoaR
MNRSDKSMGRRPKRSRSFTVMIVVLVLLVAVGVGIVFLLNPGLKIGPGSSSSPGGDSLDSDRFYTGVFVDDIPLGGLTKADAKQQIEAKQKATADATAVTVTEGTQSWQLKLSDVQYIFDTDAVVEQAWQQGRQGTNNERKAAIKQLKETPVKLKTTVTADPSTLEQKVRDLAAPYTIAPIDAAYSGYDPTKPEGQRLTFNPDTPGRQVDADALWAAVKKEFDDKTFGTVPMQVIPVDAKLKLADLQANMKLVSRFKSYLKDHSVPRYTNISLASAAVNGHFLLPGETFSFNDTTGERTAVKGYQEAHVINGGVVDNGLAGGTCQASGALFNAMVRADLDIVERNAHSLKSAYLPLGEDATVDYGHYDLKFKNNKDTPVLIIMYMGTGKDKNNVLAEVYGSPIKDGETIDLVSTVTQTIPAPATSTFASSSTVKPGTTETVKPHDGRKVTTFKVYLKNGKEVNRVSLYKSYYKEAGEIVLYNPVDGKPTPTHSASPTPKATLTPEVSETPVG